MKISASLYSGKNKELKNLVKELDQLKVDCFHIDCIDNLEVFADIQNIRQWSSTPIDLHIITSEPEKFFPHIEKYQIDYVQFQYENLKQKINFPKWGKTQVGLAIVSDTPVDVFGQYSDEVEFVLMMTTIPGQSGGTFNTDNFKKIREFSRKFPGKKIHVDGGVNGEVSFILRTMGVHFAVSGSYLVNNESLGNAILELTSRNVESQYLVKDFMYQPDELPLINPDSSSVENVIKAVEDYKLGFALHTNHQGQLIGVTSNADIRRGILKKIKELQNIEVEDIVNTKPICIDENFTIREMLKKVRSLPFLILFLPVVDSKGILKGAVTFNNMIRGES